jgi:hypothetical protein
MMLFEITLYSLLTFLPLPIFKWITEIEEMKNLCLLFFHSLPFEVQGYFYVQLIEITTHLRKFKGSQEDLHLSDWTLQKGRTLPKKKVNIVQFEQISSVSFDSTDVKQVLQKYMETKKALFLSTFVCN